MKTNEALKAFLDDKVRLYNHPTFIPADPISVPHQFSAKADIEIAGLFAAIFAWGNRTTIINKSLELMQLMDNAPHQFCTQHQATDLKKLFSFCHRTFNATDLLYFIAFLKHHYQHHNSLETAFAKHLSPTDAHIEPALNGFYHYFFSFMADYPIRTQKHIAAPFKKSTCKRLCMFLRWMVRKDNSGVDFGIWQKLQPAQLICPIDLHVTNVAKGLKLIETEKPNWDTALQLTAYLKTLDPQDPVKYDFALFGLGANQQF